MVHRRGPSTPSPLPTGASRVTASNVHFTPGARTAWHTHPNGQTIYVTEGVGTCQRRGGPVERSAPATASSSKPARSTGTAPPHRFMTHIAMLEVDDDGKSATWGNHVTDEEYRGGTRAGQLRRPTRAGLRRWAEQGSNLRPWD